MHVGPTPTHRLREEIARELFDDDSADTTADGDTRRPHDERARARERAAAADSATAASTEDTTEAADDTTERTDDTTETTDDPAKTTGGRPLAERAVDSVFESEPATDVELFDDET